MASTWVPLVAALLAGLFTLGSVTLTQRSAMKRERERLDATWAREDANRSYEHRRDAYVDFVKELHQQQRTSVVVDAEAEEGHGDPNWEFPDDWFDRSYSRLVQIQIFGTKEAAMLAEKALQIFYYENRLHLQDALESLQREIRRDLSIPDRSGSDLGKR
jgi:hypothetical protein